jgi:hypothetical protein
MLRSNAKADAKQSYFGDDALVRVIPAAYNNLVHCHRNSKFSDLQHGQTYGVTPYLLPEDIHSQPTLQKTPNE